MIFGVNYVVAKGLMPHHLEPFAFIFCRVAGALVLFWLFASLGRGERVARRDMWRLAVCGVFGVAANQLMFFYGLNLTTPINASLIMTGNPVLVLLAAAWLVGERITKRKVTGIALGLTGAIALILHEREVSLQADHFVGDLFIFLNAASYAVYLVLVKPLMGKYRPLTVIKWVFLFGFLIVGPVGIGQFTRVDWSGFSGGVWASFVFVVVGTTFLAYLLNVFALRRLNPSVVSIYIYLQPLVAAMVALIWGHDKLTLHKAVAAALIFVGVWLVSRKKK